MPGYLQAYSVGGMTERIGYGSPEFGRFGKGKSPGSIWPPTALGISFFVGFLPAGLVAMGVALRQRAIS